jgi:hypothetical protein
MRSTIGFGVLAGANSRYQELTSKPARPDSIIVGTSATPGSASRSTPRWAQATVLHEAGDRRDDGVDQGICPPATSVTAWPPPL